MDINEATAKSLQAARAVSGLTFAELSEKSGVPQQTIYRMFGAKRDIKLPQLSAVAHAMGMTVVEIMQDAERIQSRSERYSHDHAESAVDDANAALADAHATGDVPDMSDWSADEQAAYVASHMDQFDIAAKKGDIEREQTEYEDLP